MSDEQLIQQHHEEYPFPVPRLRLRHFIPGIGAFLYANEALPLRGETWRDAVEDLFRFDAASILSLGVSTWPVPQSDTERRQGASVALRHGLLAGYHGASGLLVLEVGFRVARHLLDVLNR